MSLESKIRALIAGANAKTGKVDADLTSAVQRLMDGYDGGSGVGGGIIFNNVVDGFAAPWRNANAEILTLNESNFSSSAIGELTE